MKPRKVGRKGNMQERKRFISGFTLILFIIGLNAIGCQSKDNGPPRLRYGEETCDRCRMIISEKRYSAAYRTESGALRKFDDLGCAALHREERGETAAQFWGYEYGETGWLDTKQVFLVHSPELLTPMGYGIVVLPTAEKATALAEKVNGQIVQFDELYPILQPK